MNPEFGTSNYRAAAAAENDEPSVREVQLEYENIALKEKINANFRLFEAILSNGRDGILLTGPDMRIVRAFRGLTGVDRNSLPGHLIDLLAVPEDREIVADAYRRLLTGGLVKIEIVVRFPQAAGVPRVYAATLTDMLDDPDVMGIVWNYSEFAMIPPGFAGPN